MSGQERVVVGVIASVVVVLFVLLFWPRTEAPPKQNQPTESSTPQPPTPRTTPVEAKKTEPVQPPPPESTVPPEPTPTPVSSEEPPPISGLVLTFPQESSEQEMDSEIAKCNAVVSRRRGNYVKVLPDRGSSYAKLKECLRFSNASVQEERMAPLPQ